MDPSTASPAAWTRRPCGCWPERQPGRRRHRRTGRVLVTTVLAFALSWWPFQAFQLATDMDSSGHARLPHPLHRLPRGGHVLHLRQPAPVRVDEPELLSCFLCRLQVSAGWAERRDRPAPERPARRRQKKRRWTSKGGGVGKPPGCHSSLTGWS